MQLLDRLQAATRAVLFASSSVLLQQALQRELEFSDQDYSAHSKGEQEELQWWLDHLSPWNGRTRNIFR